MTIGHKLLAAAVAASSLTLLTACGAGSPATFEAKGKIETMTLRNIQCNSQNVNALKAGKEVKIQAKGNTVAIGQVAGTPSFEDRSPNNGYVCIYDFTVSDVPAGEKFYTVVIEDQGDKEVTEAQLQDGSLVLVTHELDNMPK
ncbi:hypothetical protein M1D93_13145 [Arthrobacter sp. Z1-9]